MCPHSSQTDAFTVSFVCAKAILYIKYYPKIVSVDDEGPDRTARTRGVISAFTVNKRPHLRLIIAFTGHFECWKAIYTSCTKQKMSVDGKGLDRTTRTRKVINVFTVSMYLHLLMIEAFTVSFVCWKVFFLYIKQYTKSLLPMRVLIRLRGRVGWPAPSLPAYAHISNL